MSHSYKQAGVDLAAAERALSLMQASVRNTYGPEVLAGIGAFGGLYDASALAAAGDAVLVASTDGVGTKTLVAAAAGRYEGIGHDIVNHCANDILVQGARPLFFLDYIAAAHLHAETVAAIVAGVATACKAVGAALLGGETAEMPGVYADDAFDLVGTIVGVVRRADLIDGSRIEPGDVLLGLPSTGLHTNGYSLARRIFAGWDWQAPPAGLETPLADLLLAPHRCYLSEVRAWRQGGIDLRGLAHVTGGGVPGNLPRILPAGLGARLEWGAWPVPAIFGLIRRAGGVEATDMFQVFNMGLGMLAVVPSEQAEDALALVPEAVRAGAILHQDPATSRVQIL